MSETIRKVGDTYPPLVFEAMPGVPLDLRGCRVTYRFVPDSSRAKRREGELAVISPLDGVVAAPRPRAAGIADVTVHFPSGQCLTPLTTLRWERQL